ncbi:MAG: serine/threonine protein kinase [Deltaproteobacteria bacterium]|nr:serine/threonine protein kinase [Deltaproteobacteria bacterium]
MKKYGRYQLVDEIGQGAMGVVYRAHDPQINRQIALKLLRQDRVTSEDLVQRFLKEAQAMGGLSHPNIATVYDTGRDHGTIFIAMEILQGKSLRDHMREKELHHNEIVHIGVQVAEALDFAHRKGIVHRDIKPSNIIIDPDGNAKITDFGIAHIEDPTITQQTIPGEILGTPLYMSPEQVKSNPVDGRSDLYSLGILLYEMATGTSPFKGDNFASIFQAILQDTPPAPELNDSPMSRNLSTLIMKSLSKDPDQRFQTGLEMAQRLKACLQRRQSDTRRGERARRPEKRKHIVPMVLAAMILIVAAAGLAYFMSGNNSPPENILLSVLKVESDPTGANVFLNGSLKGRTPLTVDLPLGKYEIRLSRQNYHEWEAQLQLDEAGETPLFVRLISMDNN